MIRLLGKAARIVARRHLNDDGDTLIEVLLALIVLGLASVALMIAFGTSISASAEHRNLTTVNAILTSASQQAIAEMQMTAQQNLFSSCQSVATEESQVVLSVVPASDATLYSVQFVPTNATAPYPVEWWNETGANAGQFTSTCPSSYANEPQMFTIEVIVNSSGATYLNSFVVTLPGATSGSTTSTSDGPVTQTAFISDPGPSGTSAGSPLGSFTVAVENASGQPVNTDFSDVTLTLSGGATGATLTGCSGLENLGYVYFTGCTISLASGATPYTITATDPSDQAIYGAGPPAWVSGTYSGLTISTPGLSLVYVTQPSVGASGSAFTAAGAPEVAIESSTGVIQTGSTWTGTVTLTSSGGTATDPTLDCPGFTSATTINTYTITFTASSMKDEFTLPNSSTPATECTFSGGIRTSVGGSGSALPTSYVLFATASPTAPTTTTVGSATSEPFSVSGPGAASQLVFTTQPIGSDGAAGSTFTTEPVVTVEDAFGNVVYTGTGSSNS
ncbi:MAG: type II secretion system protein, partial [Acidimicrobiales bacterium]